MKVLLVAGTWNLNKNENNTYGKKSGLIEKIYDNLKNQDSYDIDYYNGGNYDALQEIINNAKNYQIIFWMANVSNNLPKVRDVKTINPFALVIGSKRNHFDYEQNKMEYTFVEVLNKSLMQRNNLTIEFSKLKGSNKFKMLLFDPLGTYWYDGYDVQDLVNALVNRLNFLLTTKRERTYAIDKNIDIPDNDDFYEYVRNVAEIFHETIEHADGVTRFLGNASFRGENDIIYSTRRDVDKTYIDKNKFVASYLDNDKVKYYGPYKPSKDTVVQVRLYKILNNVNYIIHSHCYAEGGYFTNTPVPCGALDEIDEVLDVIKNNYDDNYNLTYYKINLKGHGCLILASTLEELKETNYITRHLPENIKEI